MALVPSVAQLIVDGETVDVLAPQTRGEVRAVLGRAGADRTAIVLGPDLVTLLPLAVASDVVAVFASTPDTERQSAAAMAISRKGVYCDPELANAMFHLARGSLGTRRNHALTKREVSVLELLREGRSNRNIAEQLFVSEHTVRNHLHRAFRKLGVSTRAEAVNAYESRLASRTGRTP